MGQARVITQSKVSGARLARWIFAIIIIVNILAGSGLWMFSAISSAKAASTDLQRRITVTKSSIGLSEMLDSHKRADLRANLDGMHHDILQLESLIPFNGSLGPTASMHHALRMVDDLISAGQHGVTIADTLSPSLQAFIHSVSHPIATDAKAPSDALTEAGVAKALSELKLAQAQWQAAVAERKQVSQSDLRLLPIKNVDKYLQQFDTAIPLANQAFAIGRVVMPQLSTLLGLQQENRLLLFDMDSDELRPTGGFLGNYGVLSIYHGVLTSHISVHDVYTLDCPNNSCPYRLIPEEFSWFNAGATQFGMRDSNLDPDLPRAAKLIQQMYKLDGGSDVNGVILITPSLVAHILDATGPLTISQFHETITSKNLRDKLHYYHQHPEIGQQLGISPEALGTSKFKVFDVLLSKALITTLSSLPQSKYGKLVSILKDTLQTKDLQVYSNIPQLEGLLRQFGAAGDVRTAPDSLFVVDTNDEGSYANADVKESYADHVTLDAKMGAHHSLTITYDYPLSPDHSYRINPNYTDFVRVIIPANATQWNVSGDCISMHATEPGHAVIACRMILPEGEKRQLTFSWYTPPPAPNKNAAPTAQPLYQLLIQRQAGSVLTASMTVSPASGMTVTNTSAGSIQKGAAQWTANPFASDTLIKVSVGAS